MNESRDVLPTTVRSVESFLQGQGVAARVSLLPDSTATAEEAARAVGAEVCSIGKSIVFIGKAALVAVVSGNESIDLSALRQILGDPGLRKANAKEAKEVTGFPIGGVSPFGLPPNVHVVVDKNLASRETCWVAAGHPRAVAQMSGSEVVSLSGASVYSFALITDSSTTR